MRKDEDVEASMIIAAARLRAQSPTRASVYVPVTSYVKTSFITITIAAVVFTRYTAALPEGLNLFQSMLVGSDRRNCLALSK